MGLFFGPYEWPKINGAHWGYNPVLVGGWTNPFETWKWSSNWIIIPKIGVKLPKQSLGNHHLVDTVDARIPAPVDMENIPLFTGFYTSKRWLLGISSINRMFSFLEVFIFHLLVTPMETTPGSVLPEVLWFAPPSGGNPPAPGRVKRWCRWCLRMTAGS